MNFKSFLQYTAKEIDNELELFFQRWNKDIEQISSRLLPYGNALEDACRGGKRIRGSLVKLGYEIGLAGGGMRSFDFVQDDRKILSVAVAYEIFQAAILVHDDIIDKSILRRGKSSTYASLGGDHGGISKAICLGDIGFFLAFQLIANSSFPEADKNRALNIFSKSTLDTGIGELLDVDLEQVKGDAVNLADVITVYRFKTAYYTMVAPLMVGGVLGGSENTKLEAIIIFGQNLGIAFQIQDDINDLFSEKTQLGKGLGGDIKEGKKTLMYVYASTHVNSNQKKLLKKYYGKADIEEKEIMIVRQVLMECGALAYAKREAKKYAQTAKELIVEITENDEYREMLLGMTEYFVK